MRTVPDHIARPSYADTGEVERWDEPIVKSPEVIEAMQVIRQQIVDGEIVIEDPMFAGG